MIRYPRLARYLSTLEEETPRTYSITGVGNVSTRYPRLAAAVLPSYANDYDPVTDANPFIKGLAGAARTVAGALEPLQILKDPFDAIVAGAIDPDTTITERLRMLEPAAYIPFGRAPARAATGSEILELMGVDNERARSWGGFVWDVFADPLLAGTALRVGGTLAGSQRLVDIGKRLDDATSVASINRGLNAAIPAKKTFLDQNITRAFDTLMNTRVAWSREPSPLTLGDYFLPRTTALERQMGGFGRALFGRQALARAEATDVANRALGLLDEAERGVLGTEARTWFQKAGDILTRGTFAAENSVGSVPTALRDTIFALGYDAGSRVGYSAAGSYREGASITREVFEEFAGVAGRSVEQRQLLQEARDRVRFVANETNFDADEAVRRFDEFTNRVVEADALLGYHLSGYDFVKKLFYRRMNEVGLSERDAKSFWKTVRNLGMQGEDFTQVRSLVVDTSIVRGRKAGTGFRRREINLEETFGKNNATLADLLNEETSFRGLNVQDYLRGLQEGHMRRSYGLFQDEYTFNNYVANLRSGRLLPSNIIDDKYLDDVMPAGTVERQAFDAYVKSTAPLVEGSRGVLLRQSSLAAAIREGLVRSGVDAVEAAKRTRETIESLVLRINEGPDGVPGVLERLAADVRDLATKYEVNRSSAARAVAMGGSQRVPGSGAAFFRSREDLAVEVLDTLGELALPQVSVREFARAAQRQLPWNTYVSEAFQLARQSGNVSNGRRTVNGTTFVKVPPNESVYGPFANSFVHPFLKKELDRAMRDRLRQPNDFARIRALLTGGYLASPNVITANLFGGIYTSSLIGLSPIEMVRELGGTYREFRRASADPNYVFRDLDDLRNYIPVNDTTLVSENVEQAFSRLDVAPDLNPAGARALFDDVTQAIQNQLQAPLGQRWLGLDGFQFVENWLKVAAFRARRNQLALRDGLSLDEFQLPRAQRSDAALKVEAEAAEAARIAVFDYSELPETLRLARDAGILLFPGFTYFLTARNLAAAFNNPGVLAASDRVSDAINNAQMNDDLKRAVYANMPEWLRDEQGVVLPWLTYTDAAGNVRRSVIPFNQLVPTDSFVGNPWAESVATGGIYKPFIELASAFFVSGTGEAPFSSRYGQRVFSADAEGAERVTQGLGFLLNNLAPGGLRKLVSYAPEQGLRGIIPNLLQSSAPLPASVADSLYSVFEIQNQRPERTLFDEATGFFLRSPQVVMTSGPLANVRRNMEASEIDLNNELAALRARRQRALLSGNTALAQRLTDEIAERQIEYANEIVPILDAIRSINQ